MQLLHTVQCIMYIAMPVFWCLLSSYRPAAMHACVHRYTFSNVVIICICACPKVCQCNANYAGYDCSRCKFGHYGDDCSQSQILPQPPIASYTDEDWEEFIDILHMLLTHDSGYVVILEESHPGESDLPMSNITLYKLYVWLHHYASRDTAVKAGKPNMPNHLIIYYYICQHNIIRDVSILPAIFFGIIGRQKQERNAGIIGAHLTKYI